MFSERPSFFVVTIARSAKTSQKLNINRLDLRVRFFLTVISPAIFFFRFTFYYFGAIIHSLSFLDAVVHCGWFEWKGEASRCCESTDGENGPRISTIYQRLNSAGILLV